MAQAPPLLPNVWHHRKVADSSAKACWVCYKPSTSVLITPDSKDFFYICPAHLKDRAFCTPDADEVAAAAEKEKQKALEEEIEKVKKEYEEKQKKKKEKKKNKDEKDKGKADDKPGESSKDADDVNDKKEMDDKIKALEKSTPKPDEGPRIYSLHKNFYQSRVDRIRNAQQAKRNLERVRNPSTFPSVPTGNP